MTTFWIILLRIAWVLLVIATGFITLLMFAFADSPDAGKAAQKMLMPVSIGTLILFAGSALLLKHGTWWSIPTAFAMLLLPPVMVFAGYNVLMK
jgi:hypothetical protein